MTNISEEQLKTWKIIIENSNLFDKEYYLKQNPDVSEADMDPLRHYLEFGWKEGRNPSHHFSNDFYLNCYDDVKLSNMNPLIHYIMFGKDEQRKISSVSNQLNISHKNKELISLKFHDNFLGSEYSPDHLNYNLPDNPFVSIIVTNFNGAHHLKELFESLLAQSYTNFEIILVDDVSNDNSIGIAEEFGIDKIIDVSKISDKSVGFAKANNIGVEHANGDLIAIQNNDTKVDKHWLLNLVNCLKSDSSAAAAIPKVLFWEKFLNFELKFEKKFQVDLPELLVQLSYKKYILGVGEEINHQLNSHLCDDGLYRLVVELPISAEAFNFKIDASESTYGEIKFGSEKYIVNCNSGINTFVYSNKCNEKYARYIINNAGSFEMSTLNPGDRGISEVDSGQYDNFEYLEYLCGCSFLIRRDVVANMDLFISDFIAYYEDSELSLRLRKLGHNIKFCPSSLVFHKHSATNIEKSAFWRVQTTRNRFLFKYLYSDTDQRSELKDNFFGEINHLKNYYSNLNTISNAEKGFIDGIPFIIESSNNIISKIEDGQIPNKQGKRIGLFNPYWSTMGGGEAHALMIAEDFKKIGVIELISTSDFDLLTLCKFFNLNPKGFRKRLVKNMTTVLTEEYDIFINSCYQSKLISKAEKSYYIVSFPNKNFIEEFVKSYHFLPNSQYTLSWMQKYWGNTFQYSICYPSVEKDFFIEETEFSLKENLILSVGRFTGSGHIKNQLEIAKAFKLFNQKHNGIAENWKLVLIGSVNDFDYLNKVKSELAGTNHEILTNAPFDVVIDNYKRAKIYVHASGFGINEDLEPEKMEHFGMAVAQAIASGCYPIVYNGAGPKEIVENIKLGETFDTIENLVEKILLSMNAPIDKFNRSRREAIAKINTILSHGFYFE